MLPEGWVETTIGDVASVRSVKADPMTLRDTPFIGLEHIESQTSRLINVGSAADVRSAVAQFRAGDILYGRLRPYLNKVIEASFDGCASAEIVPFTPYPGVCAPLLKRVMMSTRFLEFTASLDKGDRPRVNADEVGSFKFHLPPTAEQHRIVAKLDALTARLTRARAELDRIPRLVSHLRRSFFSATFGTEIRDDWPTLATLGLSIEAGKNLKCEERPPVAAERGVVKVSAVSAERFRPEESKTLPSTYTPADRDRIRAGDILLARASGSINLVGRVALVEIDPINLYLSDKVLRLVVSKEFGEWLYWFLRSPVGRSQIEDAASGISMHNITQGSLGALRLPVPDQSVRDEAIARIRSTFARADRLEAEAARARKLIDRLEAAILAKAFRGELVPQDPDDEPASVLLERIRATRAAAPKPKRGRRAKEAADA